jgi:hypothetical protein
LSLAVSLRGSSRGELSRESSEFLEVLHLAKEAAHHVKEAVEDFFEGPEDEKRKRR